MRTFILIVACIGIGYGIALYEFKKRTADVKNIMGAEADMEGAIAKANSAKSAERKPGKIEVIGGTEFDFGTMQLGSKRSHPFIFKNVGDLPVDLQYKISSCKCTVGKLDAKLLNPGEETQVVLEWLAEGALAEFAQTATIATNAVDQEEIKLTITGKIGLAHVFDPPSADLRTFLSDEENDVKGKLYSFEEMPLEIDFTRWSDNSLGTKITCAIEEAKKLQTGEVPEFADARYVVDFTIHLGKGIPAGPFSGNMVFGKKHGIGLKGEDSISFPIQGRSVSPIRVIAGPDYNEEKNVFVLGTAKSEEGLKKSFVLAVKNDGAGDIQLKVSRVVPPAAEGALRVTIAEVKVTPKQKMYSVTLEVPAGTPPIEFAGAFAKDFAKIVLETNMESAPQFPMYIKFRILE